MTVLQVEDSAGVRYLTLNREKARNALSSELRESLITQLGDCADDSSVRAVVIRGSAVAFSSGGDVKEIGASTEPVGNRLLRAGRLIQAITELPKPVIAWVEGPAVGAGFSLALACDVIVASEAATFGLVFVKRAMVPDMGALHLLARQVGVHRAKQLAFSGESIDAERALQLGFVSHVWAADEFTKHATEHAADLASGPTVALAATKRLANDALRLDLDTALQTEALSQQVSVSTDDFTEAMTAWRERRAPKFSGS